MNESLHLWVIPLLPLLGSAINGLLGKRFPKNLVATIGLLSTGLSFGWALYVASQFSQLKVVPHIESYAAWFRAGGFVVQFGAQLDQLSLVMILVVTGVGFLIHIYSVGYMAEEGGYYRFFSYLNLFMFFMLTLVLADNYLLMFVGWEGVGLASYLLIGFYFLKDSAANAGKKAFIVNRIGDFGFLIALFLLVKHFGTVKYTEVFRALQGVPAEAAGAGLLTAIALLMFVGATGKSAQVPLYVWLPDAMEGPTPVSALIHAATMVTAGVYMVVRSNPIFSRAPEALTVVAIIACITSFMAATIGIAQRDIKRVLAYSTVSQLGYMFIAAGVAAYTAAIFHLMTHAFFKALLFLGAGSVIHALGGEQDLTRMGGLRKKIPWTFAVMTVATFAIAGFPPLAGFFSKDEILWQAWSSQHGSRIFWLVGFVTAGITSFYMFRLWFMTFFGEYRGAGAHAHADSHGHHHGEPHESPWIMLAPLVVLAVFSFVGGWVGIPHALGGHNDFHTFLSPVVQNVDVEPGRGSAEGVAGGEHEGQPAANPSGMPPKTEGGVEDSGTELALTAASVGVATLGFLLAWFLYYKRPELPDRIAASAHGLYTAVYNKYFVDEAYDTAIVQPIVKGSEVLLWHGVDVAAIDATVNNSARAAQSVSRGFRRMQSGLIRSYAGWIALGAAGVLAYMLWVGLQ